LGQSGTFQRITKGGWTAGAGIEAAFGENLTARIEYLYLKLGSATCTSSAVCGSDLSLARHICHSLAKFCAMRGAHSAKNRKPTRFPVVLRKVDIMEQLQQRRRGSPALL
jgi:hypothetical protein